VQGEKRGRGLGSNPKKESKPQEALGPNSREREGEKVKFFLLLFSNFCSNSFQKN
jgi:hypothetical protein